VIVSSSASSHMAQGRSLPWAIGPCRRRIFRSLRTDPSRTIRSANASNELSGNCCRNRSYVQTKLGEGAVLGRAAWVGNGTSAETGWPHADRRLRGFRRGTTWRPQLDRLRRYLAGAWRTHAAATGTRTPLYPLRPSRLSLADPTLRRNNRAPRRLRLDFYLQVFRHGIIPDGGQPRESPVRSPFVCARRNAEACPLPAARPGAASGMVQLRRVRTSSASSPAGHVSAIAMTPQHIAGSFSEDGGDLRADRCLFVRIFRSRSFGPAMATHRRLSSTPSRRPTRSIADAILRDSACWVYRLAP